MQQPWMQQPLSQPAMGQQQPWVMGQGVPWMVGSQFPGPSYPQPTPCPQDNENQHRVRPASEARATRRATRKEAETLEEMRRAGGQKPHTLRVKAGGGIDGGCEGKNAFDEALRSLVPRILDVSILRWKLQQPSSVEKLRSALDSQFEYLEHNLSDVGFKNAVKRQMKTERAKMKAWFMAGKKQCPVFIEPDQWARLCHYWSQPETEQKALMMAQARARVKNTSNVGRTGKAGKVAQLVRPKILSCVCVMDLMFSEYMN